MKEETRDGNMPQRIPCVFLVIASAGRVRIRLQPLSLDVMKTKDFEPECCEGISLATARYISEILNKHVDALYYAT